MLSLIRTYPWTLIKQTSRTAFFHLCNIAQRHPVSKRCRKTIQCIWLDYRNFLLSAAAYVLTETEKRDNTFYNICSSALLTVKSQILLTYKTSSCQAPPYLKELIYPITPLEHCFIRNQNQNGSHSLQLSSHLSCGASSHFGSWKRMPSPHCTVGLRHSFVIKLIVNVSSCESWTIPLSCCYTPGDFIMVHWALLFFFPSSSLT